MSDKENHVLIVSLFIACILVALLGLHQSFQLSKSRLHAAILEVLIKSIDCENEAKQ